MPCHLIDGYYIKNLLQIFFGELHSKGTDIGIKIFNFCSP